MKRWHVKEASSTRNEGKMDDEIGGDVPCSSLAVDSIIRVGTAGVIWGLCAGPYDANKLGLAGLSRASFLAKSAGKFGIQCGNREQNSLSLLFWWLLEFFPPLVLLGLFAGVFLFTSCGIQRYRKQNDWVNALIGGAVAGAAIGSGNRSWKQVAGMSGLISAFCAVANNSRTN